MSNQSDGPPDATEDKRQNSGAEITQPTNVDQQNATEPVKQSSPTSVFVNSQPMREEQVQNAVKFLSHPKVKGSPVTYRRSFLEQKGLTKEEIDEAFRRVPDSPPSVQTDGVHQDGQLRPSPNVQQQAQPRPLQPAGAPPSSGTLSRYRFHWSHALIAVGLLAASGAGTAVLIKNSILPRLRSWIRKVVVEDEDDQLKRTDSKPTLVEDAARAAKETAAAAAEMAKVSQEMLASKSEERRYFQAFVSHLDEQVQQMKLMAIAIKKLEGQTIASSGSSLSGQEYRVTQGSSKQVFVNGKGEYDLRSVTSSSLPAALEPATAPPPKSYTDMMPTVQRGERPSNSRPWELGQGYSSYTEEHRTLVNDDELISMANTIRSNGKDPITMARDTIKSNGDAPSSPWWQRKNVRIQEIENGYEHNAEFGGSQSSEQQPVRRSWVPPQPPPIAMAEAAEAIRRPKPAVPNEQVSDDQSVAYSSDIYDEVQRTPQISEPEGAREGGSVNYDGNEMHDEEAKHEEQ